MDTTVNTALRIELVGQEALVHDAVGGLVVRLTGDEHSVIVRLTNGEQIVDPTEGEQAAIDRLTEAGIVLKDASSSSMFSRRRVMQLSAAGVAAAGLSYLILPSAAAAASGGGGGSSTTSTTVPATTTTTVAPSPSTSNASTSTNLSGLLSVRWGLDGSTPFNYNWQVDTLPATTPVATGSAAANGFVSTGVTIPADTTFRVTLTAPGPLTAIFNVIGPVGL